MIGKLRGWLKRKFPFKPRIINVDLEKLYDFSFKKTQNLRPWCFNYNGIYEGLQARCDFVKLFLENDSKLSDEMVKKTLYYKLLSRSINEKPRDGGRSWIYENPDMQVGRFKHLIESLLQNGYICDENSSILDDFCQRVNPHVERYVDGVVKEVDYTKRPFEGLMTVVAHKNYFSVWNGTHRLAILEALSEKSLFNRKEIPVLLIDRL